MPGTLYLLPATLGDTSNASEDLSSVIPDEVQAITARLSYFVAENAKTTRAHLKIIGTVRPLAKALREIRIAELNVNTDPKLLPVLLQPLLDGEDGGLISEAGVPAVADPGATLVRLAHRHGIRVKPMVGPSSLLLAVMASGLNGQQFAFNGYLPTDAAQRADRIRMLEKRSRAEHQTQIFIETPYRNGALLEALVSTCHPTTLLCIATNLTLETEAISTRAAGQWKAAISSGSLPDFHKKPTVFLLLAE